MKNFNIAAKFENVCQIADEVKSRINTLITPVFMCVGSDKFVADSLGPIVAEICKKRYGIGAYVYGGLDYNINAINLKESYDYIKTIHPSSQVIFIDASLGDNVGEIIVGDGAFAGMGKTLPTIKMGDISILGVVGKKAGDFRINSVKLKSILNMSEVISKSLALIYGSSNNLY